MKSNSESVAAAAIKRLLEEGLVSADRAKNVESQLAAGKLTEEDWRLELEWSLDGGREK